MNDQHYSIIHFRYSGLGIYMHELFLLLLIILCCSCNQEKFVGRYDYNLIQDDETNTGFMIVEHSSSGYEVLLRSFEWGDMNVENVVVSDNQLEGSFDKWSRTWVLKGIFENESFTGTLAIGDEVASFSAIKQSNEKIAIDRSRVNYMVDAAALPEIEQNIDHAGIIADQDQAAYQRGARIYNSNCINCHGNEDVEGSIPLSTKFWEQPLSGGSDAYSMYLTVSRGFKTMPPQVVLTPQEKHDVVLYIREQYVRDNLQESFVANTPGYLKGLPKGTSTGPEVRPYQPWEDMDYGDFFMNTYELVDEQTGPQRFHSPGPIPYVDEDYLSNNFAYKGIAVRLDDGEGGVSDGRAWMIFDHDVMRVAGGWTGEGFIDWDAILLNDRHETYPRTVGQLHFETPVGPGWAHPITGSFDDPRFTARDGRQFGPLPKSWTNYKGLYHHGDHIIISYDVGQSNILEELGVEEHNGQPIFTRTLNVTSSSSLLKLRIAPVSNKVEMTGAGARLSEESGYVIMNVTPSSSARVKLFIAGKDMTDLNGVATASHPPSDLTTYTNGGGGAHYPELLKSPITTGNDNNIFAIDILTPPFENPWNCRMKLSGLDFLEDANKAVACATDGDIWLITGLTDGSTELTWQRIGSGLFQPLGIRIVDSQIFVTCRDQIVRLRDFDGDGETDFYESFNHDHQVTDHFHEFAMGLQSDDDGNLYYAKSGRHAREALIPQHGTLIKVDKNGASSEIIATGFRAANGVCINPDGSFIVTDQQGYWNPMNRINWVEVGAEDKFYGNMWGYDPPQDSSRTGMEPPMVWVDMIYDRSPSELLWVDSEKWGPLNGKLLSFSYGYGKIQLVLNESLDGQRQGGVIDLPDIRFLTGVMRGRFNPEDEHLYACGMSAWGTSQLMKGGGLYRVRYTGAPLPIPVDLQVKKDGVLMTFDSDMNTESSSDIANYDVKTCDLVRSARYGSDRLNEQSLVITKAAVLEDGRSIMLTIPEIEPVDIMTIAFDITDVNGVTKSGTIQNTIHHLE